MVKPPLTRIAYPRGRPTVPVLIVRMDRRHFHDPPSRLGRIIPSPSPDLCSAEEAKEKLRELIEGFFFRRLKGEDGKHIQRLLVKSPPGPLLSPARPAANRPRAQVRRPRKRHKP
jgi:hypothetical protein